MLQSLPLSRLTRLRKRVRRPRPLGPEDERQLAFGLEVAFGRPVGRAGLLELQRAEHVLLEVAVLATHALGHIRWCPLVRFVESRCVCGSIFKHFAPLAGGPSSQMPPFSSPCNLVLFRPSCENAPLFA